LIEPVEVCMQAADMCRVLVVVGMEDERSIAAGEGVDVVVGSANATVLRERLAKTDTTNIGAVYSFGVAGGLDPALRPGELLVSTGVAAQDAAAEVPAIRGAWMADRELLTAVQASALESALGKIREAVFLGSDFEARDNPHASSATLREVSGAAIIDNESHIAAEFAHKHNLPFLAVRAVSDSVSRELPPAALIALKPDGSPNIPAVIKSLLLQPRQLPALVRTARDYSKALRNLKAFRSSIGFVQMGICR
jgi:adenosylhomocysteine nucleosidase